MQTLYVDAFEKSYYKYIYGLFARNLGLVYWGQDNKLKSATYMEKSIDYHADNESDAQAYFVLSEYYIYDNITKANVDYNWYKGLEYAKKAYDLEPLEYKAAYESKKKVVNMLNESKSTGQYNEFVSKIIYTLKNN